MNDISRKIVLMMLSLLLGIASYAQNGKPALEEIVNDIKSNHIQDLGRYFDNVVPITINNSQSNYSHNQAAIVLRDFFDRNTPRDFTVSDNGSPDNISRFVIGNFSSPNGRYSIYILVRMKGNAWFIKELRITKE